MRYIIYTINRWSFSYTESTWVSSVLKFSHADTHENLSKGELVFFYIMNECKNYESDSVYMSLATLDHSLISS